MTRTLKFRLSAMMFLQYFVWGGWFVTLGTYLASNLGATGAQIGVAFSTQSWGAIVAPFFIGVIADRYFNAERLLAALHLIGAVLMYLLYRSHAFEDFYPYLFAYMLAYMPTLALANAVSFRQMAEPARQFSAIRIWGTIGWIVAGLVISLVFSWDSVQGVSSGMLRSTFLMSAVASLLLALYSLTLPKTPPLPDRVGGVRSVLGIDALKLLGDRNFLTFFFASVLICIPLAFYYQHANQFLVEIHVANATGKQTIGQMSEVLCLLLLPLFLSRFGMKATLVVGMLAWAVRYALFAYGDAQDRAWMLLVGLALHGVCYDFFFVSGQIYSDFKSGEAYKSAAQGLITFATYGVGMLVGFWVAGRITDMNVTAGVHNWARIWMFPAAFAAAVLVLFLMVFKNERISYARR